MTDEDDDDRISEVHALAARFFDNTRQYNAVQKKSRQFALHGGDKFTKRPLQYGKYLILLGRLHIQLLDLETLETMVLDHTGEDAAEKLGDVLQDDEDLLAQALKASNVYNQTDKWALHEKRHYRKDRKSVV